MKMVIESTPQIVKWGPNEVPVRLWNGTTEGGVKCLVFVHRVAVPVESDNAEFQKEFHAQEPAGPIPATPYPDIGYFTKG